MTVAGRLILKQEFRGGYTSIADIGNRWCYFCNHFAFPHGIKKMEHISREAVIEYGKQLQSELEQGLRQSSSSPKTYLSAVNTVMRLATRQLSSAERWQIVEPGKDCGVSRRQFVPLTSKAMTEERHTQMQAAIGEPYATLMALQRTFGLRFEESCLIEPVLALREAKRTSSITVHRGTKGGKARQVMCDTDGIKVLQRALSHCGPTGTLIPAEMTYKRFRQQCYSESRRIGMGGFHQERHAFGQKRNRDLSGLEAPVALGITKKEYIQYFAAQKGLTLDEAKSEHLKVKLKISKELGHHRDNVTDTYIAMRNPDRTLKPKKRKKLKVSISSKVRLTENGLIFAVDINKAKLSSLITLSALHDITKQKAVSHYGLVFQKHFKYIEKIILSKIIVTKGNISEAILKIDKDDVVNNLSSDIHLFIQNTNNIYEIYEEDLFPQGK
jgi:hypothetical protein